MCQLSDRLNKLKPGSLPTKNNPLFSEDPNQKPFVTFLKYWGIWFSRLLHNVDMNKRDPLL